MSDLQNEHTPNEEVLGQLVETTEAIRQEIGKVIIGQQDMVDALITAILSNGHVLIEGVPGVAKTLTARVLSRCISTGFSRIQFTPDLMPSDVVGTNVFNFKASDFEFKKGPVFSNFILIDEINRAPAKTQAALFEVMEERQATIDGTTYAMDEPFLVIATQNPIEQEGTYPLPEAQLDRFLYKIIVSYPNKEQEVSILKGMSNRSAANDISMIEPVISSEKLLAYRQVVRDIQVEDNLMAYMVELVAGTREHRDIFYGASPRASMALLRSSQAYAALAGRYFVTPDDIHLALLPVLRHRIVLSPEKEMEGVPVDEVLQEVIRSTEVPR